MTKHELKRLQLRIQLRLDDYLSKMKPNWDDSMTGFNEACNAIDKFLLEEIEKCPQE